MKNIKSFVAGFIAAFAVVGVAASPASSMPFAEIGDAGESILTAQILPGGVDTVTGSLALDNTDMFGFNWAGGNLSVTVTPSANLFDGELHVFDSTGRIIGAADDNGGNKNDILSGSLAAGFYYAAVSGFDRDPLNSVGGDIQYVLNVQAGVGSVSWHPGLCDLSPHRQIVPGGDCVLASWGTDTGHSRAGNYTLSFSPSTSNAATAPDPIPPTAVIALLNDILLGDALTLDGLGSFDPDGTVDLYEWDLDYDGLNFNADITGGPTFGLTSANYDPFWASGGLFDVGLRVTDNDGLTHIASTTIQVDLPVIEPAIPEPATLAIFALGLAGMGALRRRRRNPGIGIPAKISGCRA